MPFDGAERCWRCGLGHNVNHSGPGNKPYFCAIVRNGDFSTAG